VSIASGDIHKAIVRVWNQSGLYNHFRALWREDASRQEFPVLHDQEATGEQPFPYCVMEQTVQTTIARMTKDWSSNWEIRDFSISFNVHARRIPGVSRSAKDIAISLAEEIMKVFGGHPTVVPQQLTLDNGNFLITQYQNDYGILLGDDEYRWTVDYMIRVDVPVMT